MQREAEEATTARAEETVVMMVGGVGVVAPVVAAVALVARLAAAPAAMAGSARTRDTQRSGNADGRRQRWAHTIVRTAAHHPCKKCSRGTSAMSSD